MRMSAPRFFEPRLPAEPLRRLLSILEQNTGKALVNKLRERAYVAQCSNTAWKLEETATLLILADLANLGWMFKVVRGTVYMLAQSVSDLPQQAAKNFLRESLLETRYQQLSESTTKSFLEGMHRQRSFAGRIVSIENLIDDGASLANDIRENRDKHLSAVVDPYLQFVDSKKKCEFTGLRLVDVWRYFRHTWTLEYRPTPGRNLCFLIRNRARQDHPIMGIIGLANAVFQLMPRDKELGWIPESVVERVIKDTGYWKKFRKQALICIRAAKNAIRSEDLFKKTGKIKSVFVLVKRLEGLAAEQAEIRTRRLEEAFQEGQSLTSTKAIRAIPKTAEGKPNWKAASETPLFTRKRAETLANLLFAEHILQAAPANGTEFLKLVNYETVGNGINLRWLDRHFERAFKIALREIKKNGVSTRILDVNVCGASPVYREILGGKLAAYSLFSEEIQQAYLDRYGNTESEIASSMAGRPIIKPTRICALTTTSLYGVGSSQYNRVRMPFGDRIVEWKRIGESEGYGTLHMTKRTIEAVRNVSTTRRKRRNVNNQFGEGTSPLMRQLREGFTELGFDANEVLHHANKRIVYLLELYPGASHDLALDYMARHPLNPSMKKVSEIWMKRWFSMRIRNDEVLKRLETYSVDTVKHDLKIGENINLSEN